jgi:pimeloyl-ACP methyl ester carboxylesterase
MARLVETGDLDGLAAVLVEDQPVGAQSRADVRVWAGRRARRLAGTNVAHALLDLPPRFPLDPPADLSVVTCPVLVVGQEGDGAHPAELARDIADRLPDARLRIFDADGLVWAHRAELRELVSTFLNDTPQSNDTALNDTGPSDTDAKGAAGEDSAHRADSPAPSG